MKRCAKSATGYISLFKIPPFEGNPYGRNRNIDIYPESYTPRLKCNRYYWRSAVCPILAMQIHISGRAERPVRRETYQSNLVVKNDRLTFPRACSTNWIGEQYKWSRGKVYGLPSRMSLRPHTLRATSDVSNMPLGVESQNMIHWNIWVIRIITIGIYSELNSDVTRSITEHDFAGNYEVRPKTCNAQRGTYVTTWC